MFRCIWVGPSQQKNEVGFLGLGGPDLLAVDDPLIAVEFGFGRQTGQVRPRVGFAESLAPGDLSFQDAGNELLLLLFGTPLQNGRSHQGVPKKSARSGALARENSSFNTTCSRRERPFPPYSLGQLAQIQPPS